jgi:hypothetical protein
MAKSVPSPLLAAYKVLLAEPLNRRAFGKVVPSMAMIFDGDGLAAEATSSMTEAVVLFADASACTMARLPGVKGPALAPAKNHVAKANKQNHRAAPFPGWEPAKQGFVRLRKDVKIFMLCGIGWFQSGDQTT